MSINESGEWIIDQIKSEAATQGRPLTDEDIRLLHTTLFYVGGVGTEINLTASLKDCMDSR